MIAICQNVAGALCVAAVELDSHVFLFRYRAFAAVKTLTDVNRNRVTIKVVVAAAAIRRY